MADDKRQAMLTEYQACQNDNSSTAQNYWLLSGIFIGLSTALLGALLYGILANFQVVTTLIAKDACTLRTIVLVIGTGIITTLTFLYFWARRIHYLADANFGRMREIELKLGMWKSWRIHILDRWNKARRQLGFKALDELSDDNIDEIWQKTLKDDELIKGLSEESLRLLADRQEELFEICYRCKEQHWYQKPSRKLHYRVILFTLIVVWGIFIAKTLCIIG